MWTHLGNFTFSESYILKSENKTGEIHFNNIYPNSSKNTNISMCSQYKK